MLEEIARGDAATTILLVEQMLTVALKISHRVCVMGHSRVAFEGTPAESFANAAVRKKWLDVRFLTFLR